MPSGTGPTGGIAGTAGAAGMSVAGEDDAAERPPVHAVLPQAPHAAHLRSLLQVRAVRFLDHASFTGTYRICMMGAMHMPTQPRAPAPSVSEITVPLADP